MTAATESCSHSYKAIEQSIAKLVCSSSKGFGRGAVGSYGLPFQFKVDGADYDSIPR